MTTQSREAEHHESRDPHVRGRWLSDVVLGAQDGIVNTLGVILGVSSATADLRIILATGMATAAAESISMAAVAYTSSVARADLYLAEREREFRHIDQVPSIERAEVKALFAEKGFSGELLDRAVDVVCGDRETWVSMMMAEEHKLAPIGHHDSVKSAFIVGAASLVGSVVAVLPFALPAPRLVAVGVALGIATCELFALGALKARLTTGSPVRSAATLAVIGLLSAGAGYAVGAFFAHTPP